MRQLSTNFPKGSDRSLDREIGIQSGKLYRLQSTKAMLISRNSQGDLWHRRMVHLHPKSPGSSSEDLKFDKKSTIKYFAIKFDIKFDQL